MAKKRLTNFPPITSMLSGNLLHYMDSISSQNRKSNYDTTEDDILINENKDPIFNSINTENLSLKYKKVSGITDGTGYATIAHGLDHTKIIIVAPICFSINPTDVSKINNSGFLSDVDATNIRIFTSSGPYGPNVPVNALIFYID